MNEEDIFHQALARSRPEERAAYLDRACAGDPALRASVEALLRANIGASGFMDRPASALLATVDDPITERPGTVIGPYKLMEQIGEGGMGLVFLAEQQQPVRRKVALKVIKPGMDTRQVVARFEAERQALALMDHPNIAKVLDGGETASGRPYFVMELVKAVPITEFCDQNQVPIRERLELFLHICQAVQHAHQKGIIHRDLKPSNVLVSRHDTTPVVKVIDFGVAKALGQELTDKTLFTGIAQMIGTPLYMSPEQAGKSDLDVDTRSDIYSLGVLLYELLTGTTPFDQGRLKEVGYDELRRIIREEEPPRPSTRISTLGQAAATVSTQRKSDPRRLSQLFHGELDWIVMKALEKDRNRRYESASAFAADVERYLQDEPVLACPPSAAYRLRKFARRNRGRLMAATVLGLALLVAAGGIGAAALDRAARQRAAEDRILETLEAAEPRLRQGLPWDPALASAHQRVEVQLESGLVGPTMRRRAEQLQRDVRMLLDLDEIRLRQNESQFAATYGIARTEERCAAAFSRYGLDAAALEPSEAAARVRDSAIREALVAGLDVWTQVKSPQDKDRARLRAVIDAVDDNAWRRAFREAALTEDEQKLKTLAAQEEALAQPPAVLTSLGSVLYAARLWYEAEYILRQAQRRYPQDFWINYNLGQELIRLPRIGGTDWREQTQASEDAVSCFRAAVGIRPTSVDALTLLGESLDLKGDTDGAIAAFQQAIELDPQSENGGPRALLGAALMSKGRQDEAVAVLREGVRLNPLIAQFLYVGGADHLRIKAERLERKGDLDGAIAAYRAALPLWENVPAGQPGENAWNRTSHAAYHGWLAQLLAAAGRNRDVLEHARAAETLQMQGVADDPKRLDGWRDLAISRTWQANYLCLQGPVSAAVEACERAVAAWEEVVKASSAEGVQGSARDDDWFRLAKSYAALTSLLCRQAEEAARDDGLPGEARRAAAQAAIARARQVHQKGFQQLPKQPTAALKAFQVQYLQAWLMAVAAPPVGDPLRAVEAAEKLARLNPRNHYYLYILGVARYRARDWAGAIEALNKGMALLDDGGRRLGHFAVFLAMAHWQRGEKEQARKAFGTAQAWTGLCYPSELFEDAFPCFWAEAATLLGLPNTRPVPAALRPEDHQNCFALFALALEAAPEAAWLYRDRGNAHAEAGEWDRAAADFSQYVKLSPEEPLPRYWQALALLAAGDMAGYRRTCAALVEHFAGTEKPDVCHWVVWTCSLAPDAADEWKPLLRLAETAARRDPGNATYASTFGIALYRAGHTPEAIKQLEAAHAAWEQGGTKGQMHSPVYTWLFLAMAHHQRGSADDSRRWLAKAMESPELRIKGPAPWNRRLTLELFQREAQSLGKMTVTKETPALAEWDQNGR
jgi:serine/threonine protein kinase/Flp pilus assembly protein TadD